MTAQGEAQAAGAANGTHTAAGDGSSKPSKSDKRKERKKRAKANKQQLRQEKEELRARSAAGPQQAGGGGAGEDDDDNVVVEYVAAPVDLAAILGSSSGGGGGGGGAAVHDAEPGRGGLGLGAGAQEQEQEGQQQQHQQDDDPFAAFKAVLERFLPAPDGGEGDPDGAGGDEQQQQQQQPAESGSDSDDDDDEDGEGGGGAGGGGPKLTKRERKVQHLARIAELKQLTPRPDVVEVWDVTAPDPHLLVHLKASRNTVPVPRHWSQKRKYLQGKRGIEKPPFQLPAFIEATGISEMRQAYREKEDAKKLKQKQRDRMSAKTGKMDIDYAVLHDAFFRHQTKPKLTEIGDLYYEGKEYEARVEGVRPGHLSPELREALGMEPGGPPPWLVNMQRYGPPPSYPNLRVPGLNAPIPAGAEFGYQPGGWGKPPVDERGAPIYGDVFGPAEGGGDSDADVDKHTRWGALESEPELSSEEEEEEEEGSEGAEGLGSDEELAAGIATDATGLTSAGLASSLPGTGGAESPGAGLNLRKGGGGVDSVAGTPQLYTVLEQRKAGVGGGLLGTDHVYVVPGGGGGAEAGGGKRKGGAAAGAGVEVALAPEELEGLDEAAIAALYEERAAAARAADAREDFSDMVAAQAAQQKKRIQQRADAKAAKKAKGGGDDFKF